MAYRCHYQRTFCKKKKVVEKVSKSNNFSSLQHEIETLNNEEFKSNANWLQMLTVMMEDIQDHETQESEEALRKWSKERDEMR